MTGVAGARWRDDFLDSMREIGDPVADIAVAQVLRRGGIDAVNAAMRTLVHADQQVPQELPDELKVYLSETLELPGWADQDKVERGQQVFEKWGIYIALCLYCASLPSSYAAANGVQVLHLTARLYTDPQRRILETGQFLFDVLSDGGFGPDGKGRRTIQRVRLMHAAVRQLIGTRSDTTPELWRPEWGTPLNQEDLAGTLLSFSCVVIEPLRRLGVRLSGADIDAYVHLWNVVGCLLGVREDLLATDTDDAMALIGAIERRQFRKSDEGVALTGALLTLLDQLTPGYRFDDTLPGLVRHLIGEDTADLLEVPASAGFARLSAVARVVDWGLSHLLGRSERDLIGYRTMSKLARPLGINLLQQVYTVQTRGKSAPFDIPDRLAQRWHLTS
ncbi:oxygenase MpaB family protein [Mycolicibacterium sp. P9-22]|uniref:oxygenase MpaB family protein n=1 Tax=Mycolicibacterium sp. P9-22 TaxID=2024613 RepID=UPI0011ED0692|nr:oxygenase MpaB family protein [Mycolicibacterium sp. P9-22]KAA0120473.1 DUF2236 domain-containing protein [Mycolicibacterium sp. P9-22]